jgi:hypothetical protein
LTDEGGSSGEAVGSPNGDRLRIDVFGGGRSFSGPVRLPPPYDGCEISDVYGHYWNDRLGPHSMIEIPLTATGRHFFEERASARDLAYFVRSVAVQKIRLSQDPLPALNAFARRYPGRVVALSSPNASPPQGAVGFWVDKRRIVFSETTPLRRRLFVIAKRRSLRLEANNLGDLAFVF